MKAMKDIAKDVRKNLAVSFPTCKFSVTVHSYSGGASLNVALMSGDIDNKKPCYNNYQLNRYHTDFYGDDKNFWDKVVAVSLNDNYDNSDPQVDYFDTNYYLHLYIGKWNKPYSKN